MKKNDLLGKYEKSDMTLYLICDSDGDHDGKVYLHLNVAEAIVKKENDGVIWAEDLVHIVELELVG